MRYMHLKNYRLIENAEFIFSNFNFLVGDNNTGKTSILKFIETIYKNETLDFNKTYIADYSINDLRINKTKSIEVFYAGWQQNNEEEDSKTLIFEYIEIDNENQIKDDWDPLIKKIVTLDPDLNICVFNLKYNKNKNFKRKMLNEVNFYTTTNIFSDINQFKENLNLCDILVNHINNKKNTIKEYETLFFSDEYTNSLPEKIHEIIKEQEQIISNFKNQEKEEIEKYVEDFKNKASKILLDYDLLYREKSKLDISLLYSYFLKYFFTEKNNTSFEVNLRDNHRFFSHPYKIKYIDPLRQLFKKFYFGNEKILEENFAEIFEKDTNLANDINNFFKKSKMLNKIIIANKNIDGSKIVIPRYTKSQNSKKKMNLSVSGTGISQVLPILINMFQQKNDKIFIEQPEIHLHPRAQSLLGDIFFDYFYTTLKRNQNKPRWPRCVNQAFVETHSMFLINSFRYNIYKNSKNSKNFEFPVIWFFENFGEKVKIHNILINHSGKYVGEASKINNFFIEESLKILKIK